MKVVINKCFGGFGLSHKAVMRYAELSGFTLYPYLSHIEREIYKERATIDNPDLLVHYSRVPVEGLPLNERGDPKLPDGAWFYDGDLKRDDPALVRVVEEMGPDASGRYARLAVVSVPDGIDWEIDEYDGLERIEERHRSWG